MSAAAQIDSASALVGEAYTVLSRITSHCAKAQECKALYGCAAVEDATVSNQHKQYLRNAAIMAASLAEILNQAHDEITGACGLLEQAAEGASDD